MKDDFIKKEKFKFKTFLPFFLFSIFLFFHHLLIPENSQTDMFNSILWASSPVVLFFGWSLASPKDEDN